VQLHRSIQEAMTAGAVSLLNVVEVPAHHLARWKVIDFPSAAMV
jgi:hypothetical protein